MFIKIISFGLLLGLTVAVDNFDSHKSGYEFIYHDEHNLLLIIHAHNCYYTYIPDLWFLEGNLIDGSVIPGVNYNARDTTEGFIIQAIRGHQGIKASNLDALRDMFGDLLADYHCQGKHVFSYNWIPVPDNWSRPAPTAHAHTTKHH